MDNVTFIEVEDREGNTGITVIIDRGNGEFTSMSKAEYDRQQVEHLTEIITPPVEEETI